MKEFKGDTSSGRPDRDTMRKAADLVYIRFAGFRKGKQSWSKREVMQACCDNRCELLALEKIWFSVNRQVGARWNSGDRRWVVGRKRK